MVPAENAGNSQRGMRMQMQRLGRSRQLGCELFCPCERGGGGVGGGGGGGGGGGAGEEWEEWEEGEEEAQEGGLGEIWWRSAVQPNSLAVAAAVVMAMGMAVIMAVE